MILTCALLLAAQNILPAKTLGEFPSPDGKYIAKLVVGEAEAVYLTVLHNNKPVLNETDVPGIVWDPSKPHRLIFWESAIYGDGKIVDWNGTTSHVLWQKDVYFENMRWDRKNHRLLFTTFDAETVSDKPQKHTLPLN